MRARQPSPQPPPRSKSRARHDTTDIDIYTSPHETDINIRRDSHGRPVERKYAGQDGLMVVDSRRRRRAHSAAPLPVRDPMREEAEWLAANIDARGRHGEARHGATRDWTIVDVPPGTERVTMDGAGGASTETTWQRYSGVRRTKFVPDEPALEAPEPPRASRDRLSIHLAGGGREVDVKRERRVSLRPREPVTDTWTEITRDLVNKEALRQMQYKYEERGHCFYVMQYLESVSLCPPAPPPFPPLLPRFYFLGKGSG
ncbi:hypothetical protein IMZ48_08200 [Candidatus Bathyarchaeota archaeon]|nr:hypothetical protein [Candidatus Bathyarchaeota archaeon]